MKTFKMYVRTVVSNNNGKILLLKEKRMDRKARWDLPGSVLTDEESFDEAVINNIQKEIGYYVYPGKIIGVTNYIDHKNKEIHVIMTGNILNGELVLSNKYENFKWVPLDRLSEYPLKKWLNNYIRHTKEPFNDVSLEIEELDSLQNTRKEISQDNFFSSHNLDTDSIKDTETEITENVKGSFSMLKDTIIRTFHPKKAKITRTQPKNNLYSDIHKPSVNKENISEKLNIPLQRNANLTSPISDRITGNTTDDITVEHDDIETIITETSEDILIDESATVGDVIENNMVPGDKPDEITVNDTVGQTRTAAEKPADDNRDVFYMNVNYENNMKQNGIPRQSPPEVSQNQDIKIIHNNEKTPYIRKEKEAKQKISFISEGIKRQGWKKTLNDLNRTESNNTKKRIPKPKGKR